MCSKCWLSVLQSNTPLAPFLQRASILKTRVHLKEAPEGQEESAKSAQFPCTAQTRSLTIMLSLGCLV